jgi:YHS domain-containing protein
MAIDLVCGMIVDERSAPATTTYGGSDYYFCATYCREAFDREPQKFIQVKVLASQGKGRCTISRA